MPAEAVPAEWRGTAVAVVASAWMVNPTLQTLNPGNQTPNTKRQTPNTKHQTPNRKLQTRREHCGGRNRMGRHPGPQGSRLSGFASQLTGFEIQLTGFESQLTGFESQLTGVHSQLTGLSTEIRWGAFWLRGPHGQSSQRSAGAGLQVASPPTIERLRENLADSTRNIFRNLYQYRLDGPIACHVLVQNSHF